jgi:serine/threonine protein kinase
MMPPPRPLPATDPFATGDQPPDTGSAPTFDPTPSSGSRSGKVPRLEGGEPVPGYKLAQRLGGGGFGEVWKAIGPGGFAVALKFIDMGRATGKFELRSLEMMKEVRHAHLITMFGSWQVEDFLIIAMELADQTLLDRLNVFKAKKLAGIPGQELWNYMAEAAKGLDHLNLERRIQHRDIKPHNLLLVGGTVKVADFGLAKLLDTSHGSHSGSGQSFPYAAPEFFRDQTAQTSDQYSLAITYCHLRGGRIPFTGAQTQIIRGHLNGVPDLSMLPIDERPIVLKALAKNPTERWATCREFVTGLIRRAAPDPVALSQTQPLADLEPLDDLDLLPTGMAPTPLPPQRPGGPPPLPSRRRLPRQNPNSSFILFAAIGAGILCLLIVVFVVVAVVMMLK